MLTAVSNPFRLLPFAALVIACLLRPGTARAASDLRIGYGALQKLLAELVFSQEGRRYVKGGPATKCSFGYLEQPVVDAQEGRLRVRARFTGRSALNLFGACVGLGDSFDVLITARPEYRNGAITLADVRVEGGTRGFYADRVCRSLAESLPRQFAYPVLEEARRAVEGAAPSGYPRRLTRFEVHGVAITSDALVLSLDLEITVG